MWLILVWFLERNHTKINHMGMIVQGYDFTVKHIKGKQKLCPKPYLKEITLIVTLKKMVISMLFQIRVVFLSTPKQHKRHHLTLIIAILFQRLSDSKIMSDSVNVSRLKCAKFVEIACINTL